MELSRSHFEGSLEVLQVYSEITAHVWIADFHCSFALQTTLHFAPLSGTDGQGLSLINLNVVGNGWHGTGAVVVEYLECGVAGDVNVGTALAESGIPCSL